MTNNAFPVLLLATALRKVVLATTPLTILEALDELQYLLVMPSHRFPVQFPRPHPQTESRQEGESRGRDGNNTSGLIEVLSDDDDDDDADGGLAETRQTKGDGFDAQSQPPHVARSSYTNRPITDAQRKTAQQRFSVLCKAFIEHICIHVAPIYPDIAYNLQVIHVLLAILSVVDPVDMTTILITLTSTITTSDIDAYHTLVLSSLQPQQSDQHGHGNGSTPGSPLPLSLPLSGLEHELGVLLKLSVTRYGTMSPDTIRERVMDEQRRAATTQTYRHTQRFFVTLLLEQLLTPSRLRMAFTSLAVGGPVYPPPVHLAASSTSGGAQQKPSRTHSRASSPLFTPNALSSRFIQLLVSLPDRLANLYGGGTIPSPYDLLCAKHGYKGNGHPPGRGSDDGTINSGGQQEEHHHLAHNHHHHGQQHSQAPDVMYTDLSIPLINPHHTGNTQRGPHHPDVSSPQPPAAAVAKPKASKPPRERKKTEARPVEILMPKNKNRTQSVIIEVLSDSDSDSTDSDHEKDDDDDDNDNKDRSHISCEHSTTTTTTTTSSSQHDLSCIHPNPQQLIMAHYPIYATISSDQEDTASGATATATLRDELSLDQDHLGHELLPGLKTHSPTPGFLLVMLVNTLITVIQSYHDDSIATLVSSSSSSSSSTRTTTAQGVPPWLTSDEDASHNHNHVIELSLHLLETSPILASLIGTLALLLTKSIQNQSQRVTIPLLLSHMLRLQFAQALRDKLQADAPRSHTSPDGPSSTRQRRPAAKAKPAGSLAAVSTAAKRILALSGSVSMLWLSCAYHQAMSTLSPTLQKRAVVCLNEFITSLHDGVIAAPAPSSVFKSYSNPTAASSMRGSLGPAGVHGVHGVGKHGTLSQSNDQPIEQPPPLHLIDFGLYFFSSTIDGDWALPVVRISREMFSIIQHGLSSLSPPSSSSSPSPSPSSQPSGQTTKEQQILALQAQITLLTNQLAVSTAAGLEQSNNNSAIATSSSHPSPLPQIHRGSMYLGQLTWSASPLPLTFWRELLASTLFSGLLHVWRVQELYNQQQHHDYQERLEAFRSQNPLSGSHHDSDDGHSASTPHIGMKTTPNDTHQSPDIDDLALDYAYLTPSTADSGSSLPISDLTSDPTQPKKPTLQTVQTPVYLDLISDDFLLSLFIAEPISAPILSLYVDAIQKYHTAYISMGIDDMNQDLLMLSSGAGHNDMSSRTTSSKPSATAKATRTSPLPGLLQSLSKLWANQRAQNVFSPEAFRTITQTLYLLLHFYHHVLFSPLQRQLRAHKTPPQVQHETTDERVPDELPWLFSLPCFSLIMNGVNHRLSSTDPVFRQYGLLLAQFITSSMHSDGMNTVDDADPHESILNSNKEEQLAPPLSKWNNCALGKEQQFLNSFSSDDDRAVLLLYKGLMLIPLERQHVTLQPLATPPAVDWTPVKNGRDIERSDGNSIAIVIQDGDDDMSVPVFNRVSIDGENTGVDDTTPHQRARPVVFQRVRFFESGWLQELLGAQRPADEGIAMDKLSAADHHSLIEAVPRLHSSPEATTIHNTMIPQPSGMAASALIQEHHSGDMLPIHQQQHHSNASTITITGTRGVKGGANRSSTSHQLSSSPATFVSFDDQRDLVSGLPQHLATCSRQLTSKDNTEIIAALSVCEDLIRSSTQLYDYSTLCCDVFRTLLTLGHTSMVTTGTTAPIKLSPRLQDVRRRCLAALVVCNMDAISALIVAELLSRNRSLQDRYELLELLQTAAQELASGGNPGGMALPALPGHGVGTHGELTAASSTPLALTHHPHGNALVPVVDDLYALLDIDGALPHVDQGGNPSIHRRGDNTLASLTSGDGFEMDVMLHFTQQRQLGNHQVLREQQQLFHKAMSSLDMTPREKEALLQLKSLQQSKVLSTRLIAHQQQRQYLGSHSSQRPQQHSDGHSSRSHTNAPNLFAIYGVPIFIERLFQILNFDELIVDRQYHYQAGSHDSILYRYDQFDGDYTSINPFVDESSHSYGSHDHLIQQMLTTDSDALSSISRTRAAHTVTPTTHLNMLISDPILLTKVLHTFCIMVQCLGPNSRDLPLALQRLLPVVDLTKMHRDAAVRRVTLLLVYTILTITPIERIISTFESEITKLAEWMQHGLHAKVESDQQCIVLMQNCLSLLYTRLEEAH